MLLFLAGAMNIVLRCGTCYYGIAFAPAMRAAVQSLQLVACNVQELKNAARSICRGLQTLDSRNAVHHDIRAPNVCWKANALRRAAVLVDLSLCGPASKELPTIKLKDWSDGGHGRTQSTLNHAGGYDHLSDMHQLGVMLTQLSRQQAWADGSTTFCLALQNKQLTATQALAHPYLAADTPSPVP